MRDQRRMGSRLLQNDVMTHTKTAMASPAVASRAKRAKRAIGAMFFTVFGGAWFVLWARSTFGAPLAAYVPVARIFSYAPHVIAGTALMIVALLCPILNSWGGLGPVGYFAAGAILWAIAVYAVSRSPVGA
jgi:hypothetical protein